MRSYVYNRLPRFLKPATKKVYYSIPGNKTRKQMKKEMRDEFIKSFFTESEWDTYEEEFLNSDALERLKYAKRRREKTTGSGQLGAVSPQEGMVYYALVRKYKPAIIVETGVGNGFSTLCLLLGLEENVKGELISIDFPRTLDESLEEFRKETYDGYGGSAAIPADEMPGWLVPSRLKHRWELVVGKSQKEFPQKISELDRPIDIFVHDSEHSVPCMLFEFELAWHHLSEAGILISDDVNWNDAFDTFIETREPKIHGRIIPNIGYIMKGIKND